MSIRAARFIAAIDKDGGETNDTYVEAFTDIGEVRTFHKDSPDSEWVRYQQTGGLIAPEGGAYGPRLDSLDPPTAEMGAAPVTLRCIGSGFTTTSQIVFNSGEENTTYVSETEVTTEVDPSTASGPWTIPVLVRDHGMDSDPQDFAFTEPVAPDRRAVSVE